MQADRIENIIRELSFQTSRSGGKGGQHVNKTETKVHLFFDVLNSGVLTPDEKEMILNRAGNQLSQASVMQMSCDTSRSQAANKNEVIQRFIDWLEDILQPEKARKKTKVPRDEKRKRLDEKKIHSGRKRLRRPPGHDEFKLR